MKEHKKGIEKDDCCSAANHSVESVSEQAQQHSPTQQASKGNDAKRWVDNEWLFAIISLVMLVVGLVLDNLIRSPWFTGKIRFIWYAIAYVPVGLPVLIKGVRLAFKGEVFTEFILMSIATIGAFYIGEYPEGVAVMVFYAIGELFQGAAVNKAKRSIKALLDVRPDSAFVFRNGNFVSVDPTQVKVSETIQIKVGERVPLDGEMLSEGSSFNTAALTGESKPSSIEKGETVLAGMINESKVVDLKVTKLFNDSSLARILTLVQNAQGRKAKTELFIRRFAKVYTPIVVFLATGLTFLPYFFVDDYDFNQWLYRALIFLVISCPCALVVAIPLGYFGGIGAGSRNGILFKGSSYLDRMTRVDTVVMDKTGTLTKGVFKVQKVVSKGYHEQEWLPLLSAIEAQSTHPIAKAVVDHAGDSKISVQNLEEIKGHGLKGTVNGREVLAGNVKLLQKFNVTVDEEVLQVVDTIVVVALDKKLAGYIVIADEIKEDSKSAIQLMHSQGIKTVMLSGDKQEVVDRVAKELNIDLAFGNLLPENKVEKVEEIKKGRKEALAFVGDGINDAPVLAISDVGIAMGGLGSDAAIETADVVIQTDQPSKIVTAIKIGKATNAIVWQNIAFAFGVKIIVMALGAWGVASMWEAVFADVGVALLAILNAVRIQRMKF
jgi:Cd2+/Zn2+-exporting ATPase